MAFRLSHPARKCNHKDQADLTAKEKSDTSTLCRPCRSYRPFASCGPTHAKVFISYFITAHVCSIWVRVMFVQIVQTPSSRGVQIINKEYLSYIDDTDPTQAINTSMMHTYAVTPPGFHATQIPKGNLVSPIYWFKERTRGSSGIQCKLFPHPVGQPGVTIVVCFGSFG